MTDIKKSINENALLINLKISQWNGKKLDRRVTNEINQTHNAQHDAGKYYKNLIDSSELKPIQKQANAIRTYLYNYTLAWGENGERLLSMKLYFDFTARINDMKSDFYDLVNKFVLSYEDEKLKAAIRLGSMFNEGDYPTADMIKEKFDVVTSLMPVPKDSVSVNLPEEERLKIENEVRSELSSRSAEASKEVMTRVKDFLTHLRDKMKEEDPRIFESNFGNLLEFAELMPDLNIWENPKIDELAFEIRNSITENAEQARSSVNVRNTVSNKADDILNKIESYF